MAALLSSFTSPRGIDFSSFDADDYVVVLELYIGRAGELFAMFQETLFIGCTESRSHNAHVCAYACDDC